MPRVTLLALCVGVVVGLKAQDFETAGVKVVHVRTKPQNDSTGFEYHFVTESAEGNHWLGGPPLSPWHDVPFSHSKADDETPLLNFICEIPVGTTAKFEIHKGKPHNPIVQDHKNGVPRFYKYGPSVVNYGAIAQT